MSSPSPVDPDTATRDALAFLASRIDYERVRTMPYDPWRLGLDRMRRLLEKLGSPERGLPIVHVAGTKGKGSTSAMIAASLSATGYRSGLFTSPHLENVGERMTVDGRVCREEELAALVGVLRPAVEALDREAAAEGSSPGSVSTGGPTYFEIITAVALLHFAREKVEVAVLEVGLGGRLDATTACTPRVSVITSISFDHMRQLGNTLAAIAGEKAGIIKHGVPVISGVVADEPREVIRQACRERGSPLEELQVDFHYEYQPPRHLEQGPQSGRLDFYEVRTPHPDPLPQEEREIKNVALSLPGRHQAANAAVALATLNELRRQGWRIPEAAIRRALAEVKWPARIEVLSRRPVVVLDAAHNVASIAALLETLGESFTVAQRRLIFATTLEKDVRGMLRLLLGGFDEIVFTQYLDNPRAVPATELAALAAELDGRRRPVCIGPREAWETVRRGAGPEDLICITGSFFIAAEMRRAIAAAALENKNT